MNLVGQRIYDKITELINTGKIKEIDDLNDKMIKFNELKKVKGLGEKAILQLINKGIDTLDKLKNNIHLLNKTQILGVKYYKDFNTKIPRQEITLLSNKIKNYISIPMIVCGSYRRELPYSKDIDILIVIEDIIKKYNNIDNFVQHLRKNPMFCDIISVGSKKISIILKSDVSGLMRQVDIIFVLKKHYFASLMYFTGNKDFNEKLRSLVKKYGFKLNEYYLENLKTYDKIYLKNERHIFKLFNLKYLEPKERT
jgi:DNA polymerase beta